MCECRFPSGWFAVSVQKPEVALGEVLFPLPVPNKFEWMRRELLFAERWAVGCRPCAAAGKQLFRDCCARYRLFMQAALKCRLALI